MLKREGATSYQGWRMPGASEGSVAEQPAPAALILLLLGEDLGPDLEALSKPSRNKGCVWSQQGPSIFNSMPGI